MHLLLFLLLQHHTAHVVGAVSVVVVVVSVCLVDARVLFIVFLFFLDDI